MAKGGVNLDVKGLDQVLEKFEKLTDQNFKPVVYSGAGVVADEMKSQLKALRTTEKPRGKSKRYVYPYEKQVLEKQMGIAPIEDGVTCNTKVGFDGYYQNKRGDKRPVPLLANSVNAGTSFLYKQPFLSKTERACRDRAVESMSKKVEQIIEKEN